MSKKDVIQKLEDYMRTKGIIQIQLAERLGWSPSDVNNILKGRSPVGIKRLLHISHKFDMRFETEYGETKVEKTPPLYLSKTKQEIIAKIKPITEKEDLT